MFTVATVSVLSTLVAWAVYNNYAAYSDASQSPPYSPKWKGAALSTELLENADLFERRDWNPSGKSLDIMIKESEESDVDDLDHSHNIFSKPLITINRGNEVSKSSLSEAKLPMFDRDINEESSVGNDKKKDETVYVKEEYDATRHGESGHSDNETEKKADSELSHDTSESTHTKDENGKAMKIKSENGKVNAKKSNGKDEDSSGESNTETLNEHKPTSPNESFEQESLQEITKDFMNMSKNVFDLIMGDASKALDELSYETRGPRETETYSAMNNSIYVLYSLVSYILYKENDDHFISEKANKDVLADSNFGGRLVPPAALEQMKRFSEEVDDVIQQFSDFRHRKMDINVPHIENGNTHLTPEHFIGYIKDIGWEACITITAVVVLLLVLLTFAVVWGTQYMRKRRNRIRLLRIQANENHQTI